MHRFREFAIDESRAELVCADGRRIRLRPKGFALLMMLAETPGRIVTKQSLMERVWPNVHVGDDSLFQCIREIRNALGDEHRSLLRVMPGRGYLLEATPENVATQPKMTEAGTAAAAASVDVELPEPQVVSARHADPSPPRSMGQASAISMAVVVCMTIAAAVAWVIAPQFLASGPPVVAIQSINASSANATAMATIVAGDLADGLSKIPNVRVLPPSSSPSSTQRADFVLTAELESVGDSWRLRARLIRASTQVVEWSGGVDVPTQQSAAGLAASRLVAGVGYPLALRISALRRQSPRSVDANVAIEQADAAIVRTTPDNFLLARSILEKALANHPDDADLQAALAAHLLRGIQISWIDVPARPAAEQRARTLLEQATGGMPQFVPNLQTACRFYTATNRFEDGLRACATALVFDPWDGQALYQLGLAKLFLGRFEEALDTFKQADRFDTPAISRWTWLLGAGLACNLMERSAEAVAWLERSLAITPGTGRTHFMLGAALHRLGRMDEAKEAIAAGLRLRPGSTADNIAVPTENTSLVYRARAAALLDLVAAAGLPRDPGL